MKSTATRAARRRALRALTALPLWSISSGGQAQPVDRAVAAGAPDALPTALGYLPWWMAGGWQTLPLQRLDRLVLFDAPVQSDGSLLDRAWTRLAPGFTEHAAQERIPLDLALTLLKQSEFEQVFGDAGARRRLLGDALRRLDQPFVAGLHLDIEGYDAATPRAIGGFRAWFGELDEKRRAIGKGLSAFFPASDRFAVYDAAGASRIDYWVAQLYDAHWQESKVTGPLVTRARNNPVAVQRALARLGALGIPREKVLLSVPLYGWQWPSAAEEPGAAARGTAKLVTFARTPKALMPNDRLAATELARRHGVRRDREHTPYYAYRDGAHWVQGWYEDLPSLARKFAPERRQDYAGLAFFPLGYDKGELVDAMLRWWRSPPR